MQAGLKFIVLVFSNMLELYLSLSVFSSYFLFVALQLISISRHLPPRVSSHKNLYREQNPSSQTFLWSAPQSSGLYQGTHGMMLLK
jgi:hypothetical protein